MTNKDLKHLRALCDAATQGEWHVVGLPWNNGLPYIVAGHPDPHVGKAIIDLLDQDEFSGEDDEDIERQMAQFQAEQYANARFIAATDPQTVRALIDEVEELRAALEDINKHAQNQREGQGRTLHMIAIDRISKQALKGTDGK